MRTRIIIVLCGLLITAGAVVNANRFETIPARTTFDQFPMDIGEWHGAPEAPFTAPILAILGLTDYMTRSYRTPAGHMVGLYVGYWQSQRQGDAIHSPQNCLPGAGWEPTSQTIITISNPEHPGTSFEANRYVIQKGQERQVVVYWYQSHGRIVASEYWSKLYLIIDAVRLNRTDGALVRIIAPVAGDGDDALGQADRLTLAFATDLLPHLEGYIPN